MTAPVYCALLAPTEYVKSSLQIQSSSVEKVCARCAGPRAHNVPRWTRCTHTPCAPLLSQLYSGSFDVLRKTVQRDGIFGIFRGYQTVVATRTSCLSLFLPQSRPSHRTLRTCSPYSPSAQACWARPGTLPPTSLSSATLRRRTGPAGNCQPPSSSAPVRGRGQWSHVCPHAHA